MSMSLEEHVNDLIVLDTLVQMERQNRGDFPVFQVIIEEYMC